MDVSCVSTVVTGLEELVSRVYVIVSIVLESLEESLEESLKESLKESLEEKYVKLIKDEVKADQVPAFAKEKRKSIFKSDH